MDFSVATWVGIAVVVVVVVVVVGIVVSIAGSRRTARRRHTGELRDRFGDEYDVTIARSNRKQGESELDERTRSYEELDLDRVGPDSREDLTDRWKEVQYRFLEDPAYSVREAEHTVGAVMRERGYPSDSFDARLGVLSVDHPELSQRYRDAYATFRAAEDGTATLVDLFDAMVSYRVLFEALLERPQREPSVEGSEPPPNVSELSGPRRSSDDRAGSAR